MNDWNTIIVSLGVVLVLATMWVIGLSGEITLIKICITLTFGMIFQLCIVYPIYLWKVKHYA